MGDFMQIQLQRFTSLVMSIILCVLTATPTSSSTYNNQAVSKIQGGLVIELIHRDSIHPPTYPPGSTLLDRLDLALSRVVSRRYGGLGVDINENVTSFGEKQLAPLYPGGNTYYVNFYIGSNAIPQVASLDTGSEFLWIQCADFKKGHKTTNPPYDPADSTWYEQSTCLPSADWYCKKVHGNRCDSHNRCEYDIGFGDGSYSKGFIGFENLTFYDPNRRAPSMAMKVLFGCGVDNYNTNKNEDGVFGIGTLLELSIAGGTDKKFSYCLGGIGGLRYTSHLALGSEAKLIGVPVPLITVPTYILTLQTIYIGSQRLPIPPLNVMIDSGSTLSYFRKDVYNQIRGMVEGLIGTKMQRVVSGVLKNSLCYSAPQLITNFPPVILHFGPNTGLYLHIDSMFWKIPNENSFCLAILPSNDQNMIGAVMQQYHNVAFDLNSKLAFFYRTDCTTI